MLGRVVSSRSPSRLRSSTAVSESKPISWNARRSGTSSAEGCPSTAAASVRTISTSCRVWSASDSPASRRSTSGRSTAGPVALRAASALTSGRSPSRALGRTAVKIGAYRDQSTSATVAVTSPRSTAPRSSAIARRGGRNTSPRRWKLSVASGLAAMPESAHGPQASEVAASPRECRCSASASR